MGCDVIPNNSKPIIDYYIFQKKISSYLNNKNNSNRKDNQKIKKGYIINQGWVKDWKRRIEYKKISDYLDSFKIQSMKNLNKVQKTLINEFIVKDYNICRYDINSNIVFISNGFSYNKDSFNKILKYYMKLGIYKDLRINKRNIIEEVDYIFKKKMLILFFKNNNYIKMIINGNILTNLILICHYKEVYDYFCSFFEKSTSGEIINFLLNKNIFLMPIYGNQKSNYRIINENYKKDNNNNYIESNKIKRPENINFNLVNRVSFRGLENVGATCYMNATLQCFANIKPITKYLLDSGTYLNL